MGEMAEDNAKLQAAITASSHSTGMQVHSPYEYTSYMLSLLDRHHPWFAALRIAYYPGTLNKSGSKGISGHTIHNLAVGSLLTVVLSAKLPIEILLCVCVRVRKAWRR